MCRHQPDFTVTLGSGTSEVHEIKGGQATKTAIWSLKRKLIEDNYPATPYKVFDGRPEWKIITDEI